MCIVFKVFMVLDVNASIRHFTVVVLQTSVTLTQRATTDMLAAKDRPHHRGTNSNVLVKAAVTAQSHIQRAVLVFARANSARTNSFLCHRSIARVETTLCHGATADSYLLSQPLCAAGCIICTSHTTYNSSCFS
jgi:hypothetical protein